MNKLLVISLLALLSAVASAQETKMKVIEDGHEINASAVRLPADIGGSVTIRNCTQCPTFTFQLSAESELLIGGAEVTLSELRQFLDGHPSAPVLVVTPAGKSQVLRIKVAGNFSR